MQPIKEKPPIFIMAATQEEVDAFLQARGLQVRSANWDDDIVHARVRELDTGANLTDYKSQLALMSHLTAVIVDRKVPVIHCLVHRPGTVREISNNVGPGRERSEHHMLPGKIFFLADEVWIGGTDGWFDIRRRDIPHDKRFTLEEIRQLTTETAS